MGPVSALPCSREPANLSAPEPHESIDGLDVPMAVTVNSTVIRMSFPSNGSTCYNILRLEFAWKFGGK
jgi:hypothetical protein